MYRSFTVRNFRCFKDLTIQELERVNLIAGGNNVGKTALLEALYLYSSGQQLTDMMLIHTYRGLREIETEDTIWEALFYNFDLTAEIQCIGKNDSGEHELRARTLKPQELAQKRLELSPGVVEKLASGGRVFRFEMENVEIDIWVEIPPGGDIPRVRGTSTSSNVNVFFVKGPSVFFLLARRPFSYEKDAELFGNMERQKNQDVLVNILRVIEPRLQRIATVVVGGKPILHADIGGARLIPLPLLGEGMVRLASLVLAIANARGGVVLVDEIENGLHHTALPKLWRAIGEAARRCDTQVFATTHSWECIVAAHKAFAETTYDFRLHRLERIEEDIRCVTYDQETLEAAVEAGLEVR